MTAIYFNRVSQLTLLIFLMMTTNTSHTKAQDKFSELVYPFEMHIMQSIEGVEVAYADEGSANKETILFVHGLGSYAPSWKYTVQELSKTYRCIVVDLAGYGKSSKGKYPASMAFHSKHLFKLMEKLGIESYHLVGHSMGGQIGLTMALDRPDKIKSLVLIAPAGIETFTEEEAAFLKKVSTPELIASVSDEQYRANLNMNFYSMDERAEFMYNDRMLIKTDPLFNDYCFVVSEGIKGMLNGPVYDQLSDIQCPSLIIFGQQDQLIPNRYLHKDLTTELIANRAKEAIPHAEMHMIDKAGHFVHFDQPEKINTLINKFLRTNNH